MIKSLSSSGDWLNIAGSGTGASIYIDNYKLQQGLAGQVRYTGDHFEVNDGNSWRPLYDSYATIDVTHKADAVLKWAFEKMTQEQEAKELATKHPAVQDALDSVKDAEDKLKVIIALVNEEDQGIEIYPPTR